MANAIPAAARIAKGMTMRRYFDFTASPPQRDVESATGVLSAARLSGSSSLMGLMTMARSVMSAKIDPSLSDTHAV